VSLEDVYTMIDKDDSIFIQVMKETSLNWRKITCKTVGKSLGPSKLFSRYSSKSGKATEEEETESNCQDSKPIDQFSVTSIKSAQVT